MERNWKEGKRDIVITTKPGKKILIGRSSSVALREAASVSLVPGVRLPGELRQGKWKVVMEVIERLVRQEAGGDGDVEMKRGRGVLVVGMWAGGWT